MSEKAPGQYPLTDAERAVLDERDRQKIEDATRKLDEVAQTMGYVPVATFEELGLTPEQIKEFRYVSKTERRPREKYYQAERKDGRKAKLIAQPQVNGVYMAEFFSPNHHGWNHDFSLSNMQGNMRIHLEL